MRCSGVTKFSSKIEIGFYFIYLMHKLCNLTCINENENKNLGVGVGWVGKKIKKTDSKLKRKAAVS